MRIAQIAFVVDDLEQGLVRYARLLGGEAWRCYTFGSQFHATAEYHGAPAEFSARLALTDQSTQIELIEPLDGAYANFDRRDRIGVITEVFEPPERLHPPDAILRPD